MNAFMNDQRVIVLANGEPVVRERTSEGRVVVRRGSGGLVTALEPLMRACRGVWVARGTGDEGMAADTLPFPLRRVWLNEHELRGYYYGFANEALWPLCHRTHVQPVFRSSDFEMYRSVNSRFADAVAQEATSESPLVLVQDYHFALAPQLIRQRSPHARVVTFWHIPWPHPSQFEICPWASQLIEGLLGSDIVGFQTPADCANFIDTVASTGRASIDYGEQVITHDGGRTEVRAYPVSVEWPNRCVLRSAPVDVCRRRVRRALGLDPEVLIGVGIDRMDFTKGLEEKFLTVERLLECQPELRERFVLVQVAEPSRDCLPAYRALRGRLLETMARVNQRFSTPAYRPIVLLEAHHEPAAVYEFLRAADVCYVGSLHDGMNLVAKEFVSARDDDQGVLVLSRFAGAARQLPGALLINPYAIDDTARALAEALVMSCNEQTRRMRSMRVHVAETNAYWWAGQLLQDAARLESSLPATRHVLNDRIPA